MSFTMDDVMQAIQIMKECNDCELHIETGDVKLSIWKGDIEDSAASAPGSTVCISQPAETQATPVVQAVKEKPEAVAAPAPAKSAPAASAPAAKGDEIAEEGLVPIKADVTSVFYRKPSPEELPFVEVGSEVKEDTVVCLLEVMKCFRQVMAGVKGTIAKILAESGELVEQGADLFLIRPS